MSDVKRYTASIMHPGVREDPEGLLVAYRHYEELKAEVEELKDALFKHSGENYHLQIQRERLTKAGDAMLPLLGRGDYDIARNDWNAAKGTSSHD